MGISKRSVSQNLIALRRYGQLFKSLDPEKQQEILFDMEQDMLVGRRETVLTDRSMLRYQHPRARAGDENFGEGEGGKKQKGVTLRKSPRYDHLEDGGHVQIEGGERKG